jgi:predicted RNA-binding Zn-ribbon protein involved in translation (DUF1610 family)
VKLNPCLSVRKPVRQFAASAYADCPNCGSPMTAVYKYSSKLKLTTRQFQELQEAEKTSKANSVEHHCDHCGHCYEVR